MAEKWVIIVGGGSGKRMGSDTPKQFLLIGNKPVIIHTIERFVEAIPDIKIILVLPESHLGTFFDMAEDYYFPDMITVKGGATRFQSVKNGLAQITDPGDEDLIAIHDAVRPFVGKQLIERSFQEASISGTAIPALQLRDSLRKIDGENSNRVDRDKYRIVQTPQCFKSSLLIKAYEQKESNVFTDDASVVEKSGVKISLIPGEEQNIKITHPADLLLAEAIHKSMNTN